MVINIDLENIKIIHHPFNHSTLNPELGNYIYEECKGYNTKNKIALIISLNKNILNEEKDHIKKIIINHFKQELKEEKIKDSINFLAYIFLSIIGILFIFLTSQIEAYFIKEIFNIIGWLTIWELAYDIIFTKNRERIKKKRYKQIILADITFKNSSNTN